MQPGRLWSLWQIMRRFSAIAVFHLGHVTGQGELAPKWAQVILSRVPFIPLAKPFSAEAKLQFVKMYASVLRECISAELEGSAATLGRILGLLEKDSATLEQVVEFHAELYGRLSDELASRVFFSLNTIEANYYSAPREGWEEIIDAFPSALIDIEEARKCFALSRYAAAVFHSLQVIEFGLVHLGAVIGVQDPNPGWSATINALDRINKKKFPDRTPWEQAHSKFLEQIQGTIAALNSAWRNKVHHAHEKLYLLSSDFNEEIAEEILFATRAFMRRIAEDCPSPDSPEGKA
jgi:hypothetical protein